MQYKWKVFKDYYLKYVILAVIAVAALVYFCYHKINLKENVLQIVMMDVRCPMEEQEEFEKQAGEIIGIDTQKELVDLSFCHSNEMLVTMMVNDKVDILLMNEMFFEVMASELCLSSLNEIMCEEENGEEGIVYGFSVVDNPWIDSFGLETTDDIIVGIAVNSPHKQNSYAFVTSLLENE